MITHHCPRFQIAFPRPHLFYGCSPHHTRISQIDFTILESCHVAQNFAAPCPVGSRDGTHQLNISYNGNEEPFLSSRSRRFGQRGWWVVRRDTQRLDSGASWCRLEPFEVGCEKPPSWVRVGMGMPLLGVIGAAVTRLPALGTPLIFSCGRVDIAGLVGDVRVRRGVPAAFSACL